MNRKLADLLLDEVTGHRFPTRGEIRRRWSNVGIGWLFLAIVWALILGTDGHGPFTWRAAFHLTGLVVTTIGCVWAFRALRE